MASAIFSTTQEASEYKRYLKATYKKNLVFHNTGYDNEVVYEIPFNIRIT